MTLSALLRELNADVVSQLELTPVQAERLRVVVDTYEGQLEAWAAEHCPMSLAGAESRS